ncbi:MAG TPA: hypothetical protein PLA19_00140 [Candidatus Pacearchaeota archaeon]|jgi:hypothetical protein|nr:hypothetical protein [Candidatus Pacearchaeota archaeon]
MIQIQDAKEKIREAVREFKALDRAALLKVNIYEAAISHRIAVYLGNLFRELNVDCEYSRNLLTAKKNGAGDKIRPDIIIHKRLSPNNCIIFEIKKGGKDSLAARLDIKKLQDAVAGNLGYDLGVFIGVLKRRIDICWIEKINGNLSKNCETV